MRFLIILFLIFFMQNNLSANTKFFEEGLKLFNKEQFEKAKFKFEQDIVFNPKSESSYLYLFDGLNAINLVKQVRHLEGLYSLNTLDTSS